MDVKLVDKLVEATNCLSKGVHKRRIYGRAVYDRDDAQIYFGAICETLDLILRDEECLNEIDKAIGKRDGDKLHRLHSLRYRDYLKNYFTALMRADRALMKGLGLSKEALGFFFPDEDEFFNFDRENDLGLSKEQIIERLEYMRTIACDREDQLISQEALVDGLKVIGGAGIIFANGVFTGGALLAASGVIGGAPLISGLRNVEVFGRPIFRS